LFKFHFYKWHSINLIPQISIFNIVNDHPTNWKTIARCIEIILFGIIFIFEYPSVKEKKYYSSKIYPPLWSRKRKTFYLPFSGK